VPVKILVGDCRERLKEIESETVSLCITSPPYFGLRAYKVAPTVWDGREDCAHEWRGGLIKKAGRRDQDRDTRHTDGRDPETQNLVGCPSQTVSSGQFCRHCNAWLGTLGNEPSIEMYVQHLVEIFREVRRVLHPAGCLILNLGDSFASQGGPEPAQTKWQVDGASNTQNDGRSRNVSVGLKPKDLMGIPYTVAFALRDDGWWLRQAMPWPKKSAMPESVRDRPTTAHEYIFLLAKSKSYYWDSEAIRIPHKSESWAVMQDAHSNKPGWSGNPNVHGEKGHPLPGQPSGRNYRTTDPWFAGLDLLIDQQREWLAHLEYVRDEGGLLLDENGDPLALQVNTVGFPGSHFAVFPPDLVLPFVRAGSSERGVCSECRAPWERVVDKQSLKRDELSKDHPDYRPREYIYKQHGGFAPMGSRVAVTYTTGWRPTCDCNVGDPVPAIVLDPFAGAGTTLMVADREQRDAIGVELSLEYTEISRDRIADDGGMFTQIEIDCGDGNVVKNLAAQLPESELDLWKAERDKELEEFDR